MNAQALIIDGRTRKVNVFVASVTTAQSDNPSQIVLRHALDMGHVQDLLAPTEREEYLGGGETKKVKSFRAEMPVIIMGEYSGIEEGMGVYSRPVSPGEVATLCRLSTPTGTDTGLQGF